MEENSSPTKRPGAPAVRWAIVAFAVAGSLVTARYAEQAVFRQCAAAAYTPFTPEPTSDPHSSTGFRWYQHRGFLSNDGYQWVLQTQQMLAEGGFRVRAVAYDNHPVGREVHWASGFRWWLVALAALWSTLSGTPLVLAVEAVAPYANPLLLMLLIVAGGPLIWRRFGPVASACAALALATVVPLLELFGLGDPDHHGLSLAFCAGSVFFLMASGLGSTRARGLQSGGEASASNIALPEVLHGNRYFVAAGVAGGAGLWMSAASQVPVLVGIVAGALGGAALCRMRLGSGAASTWRPELWRIWGTSGAVTSLGFYLLEYFPSHLGMRLEVNHPLYAIAFWGAGEVMCQTLRKLQRGGVRGDTRSEAVLLAAGLAAIFLLPLVIVLSAGRNFWVADRTLWALHEDYIAEFHGVVRRFSDLGLGNALRLASPLPLLVVAVVALLRRRPSLSCPQVRMLLVAVGPAFVMFIMSLNQVRWIGFSCGLWILVFVAVCGVYFQPESFLRLGRTARRVALVFLLAVMIPGAWQVVRAVPGALTGRVGIGSRDVRTAVVREVAGWLRARVGQARAVVLSGPGVSTPLIYHGGFSGVGTLYWENKEGLQAMVDVFGTGNPTLARELATARGVTHVMIFPWDSFAEPAARLVAGLRRSSAPPGGTFLAQLEQGRGCPPWLRPVAFPQSDDERTAVGRVLVYEVVPEQSREEAALSHAQFLFAGGRQEDAGEFLRVLLEHFPDSLRGWITMAQVQSTLGKPSEFLRAMNEVDRLQAGVERLAFEDRLNLTTVLALAGRQDGAARQFQSCVDSADEASVRRLPPDGLLNFYLMAKGLGDSRRPALVELAWNLLPEPHRRHVPVEFRQ